MIAELISVGTEILLGNIVNTNANYLARKCAELGITNYYQVSVGDNEERLAAAINAALTRSDLLILTGGLGPTKDDLTKEVTAKVLNKKIIEDSHTKDRIKEYFTRKKGLEITENNWKQALIIEGSTVVDNPNGTAPGLIVETEDGKIIILLPGPPNELEPMFQEAIFPYLNKLQPGVLYSEMIKICGIGESKAETMIQDLITHQTNPTIAPYAKTGEVHLRITASASDMTEGKALVKPVVEELEKRFSTHIYTNKEEENLEDVVVNLLAKHKLTITTAESCTGGLLTGRLVNVPGASEVLDEGFITYSNEAKEKYLNVSHKTLESYGAVSRETAVEMARGACENIEDNKINDNSVACDTGINNSHSRKTSLAITGIAGPGGGSEEKPVGTVYIGCMVNGHVRVKKYQFKGNRQKVREYAVINGLDLLRTSIIEEFE
ncbi:competence/damage-inducible protein A [Anaerocolumna aminovalerica]|jgi:nicotinamide-nucleotide amidase|uniref:Putative competence-damage inducible protein n=1 Tax=Anaerocolumna aminovalerica TaxID=1527 RepID=A0A1I5CNL5_9FIRM|nr:competence/damage-inducible protein A [Anaerocolumna aminovalerica]MDU6264801.1 competence/damage-inducible protein A [Anaerocolumna aminovalerica]SFN88456.1 nicotinamide-nucleotide amidase [Anaerocolumna aminovalerica]